METAWNSLLKENIPKLVKILSRRLIIRIAQKKDHPIKLVNQLSAWNSLLEECTPHQHTESPHKIRTLSLSLSLNSHLRCISATV
jgi:hypothetical protein